MNTTATHLVKATDIPRWAIDDIVPSPFQSRRDFNEAKLREMAGSITEHDIIQPITLRRVTPTGPLELVCGERRLRAGKLAGLVTVPYILRELTDAQAENIVLTENIQREDLKPSEEATHYDRLLKIRDAEGKLLHTRETVAKLASKTLNYIDDHLKLLVCPAQLQEAVDKGYVALSVAMVVGRIPDAKLRSAAAVKVLTPDYQQVPMNFTQAKEMVRQEFMVSLERVPWELDDASLLPVKHEDVNGEQVRCFGGACVDCPFLSANIEGANVVQREGLIRKSGSTASVGGSKGTTGAKGNLCTQPKCHGAKLDAVCRGQKVKALEKGLKVLDDKDAAKQFHPSKNETANGAKYVWLDAKPADHEVGWQLAYHNTGKIWRTLLKGSEVPVVMARNPHTGLLVEMAPLKEAKPVGEKALRQKKDPEKEKEKSPAELKAAEDAKKLRAAELRQEKIDAITLPEALTEIRSSIESKGVDARMLEVQCDMAIQQLGSDATKFIADTLEIPRQKTAGSYGLDKPIKAKIKELCEERVVAWHAMLTLLLMSWELSHNKLKSVGFKAVLGVLGIKLTTIESRAKALFEGQEKGKAKGKVKAAPAAPTRNSTDDSHWTADGVADTTAAADKVAKDAGAVRTVADYNCDCCSVPIHCPPGTGKQLCQIAKGELKCQKCGGQWENRYAGWKREGFNLMQHPEYHAAAIALGEWTYEDCIGHEPTANTRSHKEWKAKRAKIEKAVKKLLAKVKKPAASASGADEPAQELLFGLDDDVKADESKLKPGQTLVISGPVEGGKSGLQEGLAAALAAGQVDIHAVPLLPVPLKASSGPSAMERVTGIQDSKLGKPGMFTKEDITAGAVLLMNEQMTITELIGPKPDRKKNEAGYKTWNSVRMKLLRNAGLAE